ncbi:MAG: hypothetical protein JSU96_01695 [Acidobacteriota bacterium]|nr:MAG: hypothetical protein JSU96_01695 [Acidobacteriota bacterium]
MQRIFLVVLYSIILILASAATNAQVAEIVDLGLSSSGTRSEAVDVNDAGEIVGYATYASGRSVFYRDGDGQIEHDIRLYGEASPLGINNLGDVIGWSRTEDFAYHTFRWNDGVIIDLGTFGGRYSQPRGFNDVGQIVGDAYACTNDCPFAAIWEPGALGPSHLGGNIYSFAHDINNLGDAVGMDWVYISVNGYGRRTHTPVLWKRTDNGYERIFLTPGLPGQAVGINDLGQIIGYYQDPEFSYVTFVWENGVLTTLGEDGSGFLSSPKINNAGQVIGTMGQTAWLWEAGEWTNLGGLGKSGLNTIPTAINDFGQIVGSSYTDDYRSHAFLWENGEMIDLGTLEGDTGSLARNLSNFGLIVGFSSSNAGGQQAVLWKVPASPRAAVPEIDRIVGMIRALVENGRFDERIADSVLVQMELVKKMLTDYRVTGACQLLQAVATRIEALVKSSQLQIADGEGLLEAIAGVGTCQ